MLLPVTHYLYLALALFCIGLAGALLRRALVVVLLSIQLMLAAVALVFCAYAALRGDAGGQLAALAVVLVGLVELAVAVAVVVRARRAEQGEGQGEPREASLLDDWLHERGAS